MHFVDKSKVDKTVIDRLAEFDKKESLKWGRYFTTNPRPNAPRSHWTDDEIRLPLVEIFQKNCGYCGKDTNNTTTEINTKQTFSGSVDHYIPKSIDYEKIYDWKNYIWACSDCNFKKSDYYNVNAMILNPCDKNDCESLYFIGGTCVYELISDSDELLKERFRVTVLHTLINNDDHI